MTNIGGLCCTEKKPKKYRCNYHGDHPCHWKGGGGHVCLFTTKEPPEGEISRGCLISLKTLRGHLSPYEEAEET
jgi:hypothetical protein